MPKDSSNKAARRAYLKKRRRDRNQPVVHREALGLQPVPSGGGVATAAPAESTAAKSDVATQPLRGARRGEVTAKAMLQRFGYVGGEIKRILVLFGIILIVIIGLGIALPRFG